MRVIPAEAGVQRCTWISARLFLAWLYPNDDNAEGALDLERFDEEKVPNHTRCMNSVPGKPTAGRLCAVRRETTPGGRSKCESRSIYTATFSSAPA